MNIKKIILLGAFLSFVFINTQIFAQQETNDMQMMHGMMGKNMMMDFSNCPKYTELNENQKADIKKITDEFKNKMEPIKKDLMAKMVLLRAQLMQTDIDEKQVTKLTKEISDLHNKMFTEGINTMLRIKTATGFTPIECDKKNLMDQPQEDKRSNLPSNPEQGLQTSSQQGFQNNSSQGLQTGPSAISQTPPCKNGDGQSCAIQVSNDKK